MKETIQDKKTRRAILGAAIIGSGVYATKWSTPLVNSVLLPAHAQTSALCVTDTTVGGPLIGNASGAATCQAACEAEAASQNAQLCDVREFLDASNATQCDCDLDLP